MTITRGLIIKGVVGVLSVGGVVTTGGLLYVNRDRRGEDEFGIPKVCWYGGCELSEGQLKKVKFKELEGVTGDLTVEGLVDKKIKFRMEKINDKQYPNKKKYVFDNISNSSEITIKGKTGEENQEEKELKMEKEAEVYFKEDGKRLVSAGLKTKLTMEREKKMKEANGILERVGLSELKLTLGDFSDNNNPIKHKQKKVEFSREDDFKKISFKELGGKVNEVVGGLSNQKIRVYLEWSDNTNSFPNNMKFKFANTTISPSLELKGISGGSIKLAKSSNDNDSKNTFKIENHQLVASS